MSCDLMCVTGSKDHMTLRMGASHCKSASCIVWCPWDTAGGDKMYLICHVTSYDHPIEEKCKLMGGSFLCMYVIFIVCIYKPLKNKQIALTIYQSIYIKHCDSGDVFNLSHHLPGTRLTGYMNLRVETLHCESPPCHVWWALV